MNLSNLLDPSYLLQTLIFILAFVFSISFHERSHAWAAWKLGDDTAYLAGRLTMNPLAHIDILGLIMVIVARIGWAKPVPMNPVKFRGPMKRGIVLVSIAGPVSNLILAVGSAILYVPVMMFFPAGTARDLLGAAISSTGDLTAYGLLLAMFTLNIMLAIFNFFPIPPLDGYKVLGAVLPNRIYYALMRYEQYIGLAFLALVILGGGILSRVITFFANPIENAILTPIIAFYRLFA
jgi:Zn-dependent protease